ncbi:MAG: MarR family transcriptional regulator [Ponticaulis sp.]|nr:MarR family transcriptional regulator [Ponticaulis sp.]|tara:strand:+ start:6387 stop:6887 length:501 start_codon:yes stop_codon:yes gene_type:complete
MSERARETVIAIRQIQRKIDQSARQIAQTEGITPSQLKVLQLLTEYPEISVGWVGEQTRLKNATITNLVDKLVERKLVSRRRCDSDRRRVWIRLEPAGRQALENAPDLLQARFEERFDNLPDWQQSMLLASLELLAEMLEARNPDTAAVLDASALGAQEKLPDQQS